VNCESTWEAGEVQRKRRIGQPVLCFSNRPTTWREKKKRKEKKKEKRKRKRKRKEKEKEKEKKKKNLLSFDFYILFFFFLLLLPLQHLLLHSCCLGFWISSIEKAIVLCDVIVASCR